jgi:hypothetical protein
MFNIIELEQYSHAVTELTQKNVIAQQKYNSNNWNRTTKHHCFTSHSGIFQLHIWRRHHYTGKGLQHFGLCSALRAFEQGGVFIVPHLLWHRTSVFPVSSEGPLYPVASYDTQGDVEDLFYPGSSRVSNNRNGVVKCHYIYTRNRM